MFLIRPDELLEIASIPIAESLLQQLLLLRLFIFGQWLRRVDLPLLLFLFLRRFGWWQIRVLQRLK